ncbi:carboxypeptidase-like regulatory domain-containing protein [Polaribacter porphyrae]|uniref:TonB-dependent receptor n=1 Tax=Polaribacter porphyrae TaxID=1137780 RepID=A0A2S7WLS7_9FLAO|nr:carboxypeptidase-like regulatory domain-containing protein [Polaribacter porphyrae]PQJ78558.1 hypothetical protein BTO18_04865 [Polaribacter porphyrae]
MLFKTKLLFLVLIFSCSYFNAQNKKTIFKGKIIDSLHIVANANIINLKTNQGTFSNDNGIFRIRTSKNDSLKISAIGYETKFFVVKAHHLNEDINLIFLMSKTYQLDEIIVKKHNLIGSLAIDFKKTPVDKNIELVDKIVSDIKKMDFYAISKTPIGIDEAHLMKADIVRLPNNRFEGMGIKSSSSFAKDTSFIEKLEEENKIAKDILSELGDYFFFIELKIPKNEYNNFFDYCLYKDIVNLYKKNQTLKVIQIFRKECISFLKLIKKK